MNGQPTGRRGVSPPIAETGHPLKYGRACCSGNSRKGSRPASADAGALPSFPAQTSRNEIAAHYCASPSDRTQFKSGDLVKIDLGAHIDGYPVDTGVSVDLSPAGRWADIIGVAGAALDAAIAAVKDGEAVGAVGTAIGDLIDGRGYKPIYNLAGHGLGRWQLHSWLSDTQQRPTRWPAPPAGDDFRHRTVRHNRRRIRSGWGQGGSVHEVRRTDAIEQDHWKRA